jgi:hypothetical protein
MGGRGGERNYQFAREGMGGHCSGSDGMGAGQPARTRQKNGAMRGNGRTGARDFTP